MADCTAGPAGTGGNGNEAVDFRDKFHIVASLRNRGQILGFAILIYPSRHKKVQRVMNIGFAYTAWWDGGGQITLAVGQIGITKVCLVVAGITSAEQMIMRLGSCWILPVGQGVGNYRLHWSGAWRRTPQSIPHRQMAAVDNAGSSTPKIFDDF